jgi:Fuc2NAc and GlcNAc transferase
MTPLPSSMLAVVTVAALVLAAVVTPVFRALALRAGLVDRPNARSSHDRPVARGGGVPILLAAAAGLAIAGPSVLGAGPVVVLLGGLVLGVVGLCDDLFGLSPLTRIAVHLAAAIAVVWACGGWERLPLPHPLDAQLGRWGAPLTVLWVVAIVNFYNFLDGIDGLAAAQGLVTGAGLALAGWEPLAAACGAAIAGACAGFLVHNWAPASIFMGDVGSGALGFLFAALPLLAPPPQRSRAALFVALSLWFFLVDATWTLARRIARGERWYEAHRQHLYQQLVVAGASHARVASALALGALVLTAAALGSWYSSSPSVAWSALGLALAGFGLELTFARNARGAKEASPGTAGAAS